MSPAPTPSPFKLPDLHLLSDELVRGQPPRGAHPAPALGPPCLSFIDHAAITYSSFGGQLLFRTSIDTQLLKQALSEALAVLPWFAGRLGVSQDARTYDLVCTNAGARLLVGSSSATLEQVAEALAPGGRRGRQQAPTTSSSGALFNLMEKYGMPRDPGVIVSRRLPLCTLYLLHLRGGGSLLALSVWHGMADFEGLQTLVAHTAAKYNTALGSRRSCSSGGNGGGGGSGSTTAAAGPTSPPADRFGASYSPAVLEALADPEPPPPGSQPRESFVAVPRWKWGFVLGSIAIKMMVQGGGVEVRTFHISAQRLSELKAAATLELRGQERAEAEEVNGVGGGGGATAVDDADKGSMHDGDLRSGVQADGGGGRGGDGGEGVVEEQSGGGGAVEWVSTRDCLAARLAQVLHALPQRRRRPMSFFVAANMRPRLQPPLPAGQLGNIVFPARVGDVRPSEMGLGRLAARVRATLNSDLPAQYRRELHRVKQLVAAHDARRLLSELMIDPDPTKCLMTPQGPFVVSDWSVKYNMWQFGPEPPIAFAPIAFAGPNVFAVYPATPGAGKSGGGGGNGGGGGLCLYACLHRTVWRQLDRLTGGNPAAAI